MFKGLTGPLHLLLFLNIRCAEKLCSGIVIGLMLIEVSCLSSVIIYSWFKLFGKLMFLNLSCYICKNSDKLFLS